MKTLLAVFAGAMLAVMCADAQTRSIVIQAPVQTTPVFSPLTNATAQSNQALLDQINSTISQRAFQNQMLNLQTSPTFINTVPTAQPSVIIGK